jgi:hypothetical protein
MKSSILILAFISLVTAAAITPLEPETPEQLLNKRWSCLHCYLGGKNLYCADHPGCVRVNANQFDQSGQC